MSLQAAAVQAAVVRLIPGLAASIKSGESQGILHSKRLAAAIQASLSAFAPGQLTLRLKPLCSACQGSGQHAVHAAASWVVHSCPQHAALNGLSSACLQACKSSQLTAEVLQNPVQLQVILLELTQGLAFDPAAAALLLHHTSTGGAHLPQALPATEQGSAAAPRAAEAPGCCAPAESSRRGNALALSAAVAGPVDRQPGSAQEPRLDPTLPTQHALPEGLQLPAVELPRMPGGLKFIATGKAYEAAAKVARVLGHAAAGSGGPADKGVAHLFRPGCGALLCVSSQPRKVTCSSAVLPLLQRKGTCLPQACCGM